jgi:hypothetical protein
MVYDTRKYWDFLLCPSSGILKELRTRRFGTWNCFRLQKMRKTPILLCPLERAIPNPVTELSLATASLLFELLLRNTQCWFLIASILRLLVSGSPWAYYHFFFRSVRTVLSEVTGALIASTNKLSVVSSSVLEGAGPSTISCHLFSGAWRKNRLLALRLPAEGCVHSFLAFQK